MRHHFLYTAIFLLFLGNIISYSQETDQYNINIYNGLPTNNAYNTISDHLGYLWISTEKGVLRYNGYSLKLFDFPNSFANRDVWNFYEDRKGRMWLYSISNTLGYIRNEQYHTVYSSIPVQQFYPYLIEDNKDGVFIINKEDKDHVSYFIEQNDTLKLYHDLSKYFSGFVMGRDRKARCVDLDDEVYVVELQDSGISARKIGRLVNIGPAENGQSYMMLMTRERCLYLAERYFVSYQYNGNYFRIVDLQNSTYRKLRFGEMNGSGGEDSLLVMAKVTSNNLYLMSARSIYVFDTGMGLLRHYRIDSMVSGSRGERISDFRIDSFWHCVMANNQNGIYLSFGLDTVFKKIIGLDLSNCKYVGRIADKSFFWWDNATNELIQTNTLGVVRKVKLDIRGVSKIVRINGEHSLLLAWKHNYVINNGTLKLMGVFPNEKDSAWIKKNNKTVLFHIEGAYGGAYDGVLKGDSEYFFAGKSYGAYVLQKRKGQYYFSEIDTGRCKAILYDSVRKLFWAYDDGKIVLFREDGWKVFFTADRLRELGINNVEKILVDNRYGNVFLQERNRLLMFSDLTFPYSTLFERYIQNDAKTYLQNDVIVVTSTSGILFSRILGKGKVSAPVFYPNIKELKYTRVYDAQVSEQNILLSTDRGMYSVNFPTKLQFAAHSTQEGLLPYRLLLSYSNAAKEMREGDTVAVSQRNTKLQFDIIKPDGSGVPRYYYKLGNAGGGWKQLSANELNLPALKADGYYTLDLRVADDQWASATRRVYLYIIPYWWQKPLARQLLLIAAIVMLLLFSLAIVLITKKIVTRRNTKRNLQLELELKSIYSQLNPHFIFNSLNSAMYLVKLQKTSEAYAHIHKFSDLLRSYIRSSRNRSISIDEEVTNLKNYIELQQARFKNKFDYEIVVDDTLMKISHIPSLLLQPLVENAIIHGLLPKAEKGKLLVAFKKGDNDNELLCIVDDDGIGRKKSRENKRTDKNRKESYGEELITDLISIFNKYMKMRIAMTYIDKELPETGTRVILKIRKNIKDKR